MYPEDTVTWNRQHIARLPDLRGPAPSTRAVDGDRHLYLVLASLSCLQHQIALATDRTSGRNRPGDGTAGFRLFRYGWFVDAISDTVVLF